jgi:hypothetical protein
MPHSLAAFATTPTPSAGDLMLDRLAPLAGVHALVLGHDTLEVLCGLIRRGAAGAIELRPDEHGGPRPDSAQLAVLPDPASVPEAAYFVAIARRALRPGGRIAIRDAGGQRRRELAALLRAQGFVAICTHFTEGDAVVLGERPAAVARA